MTEAALMNDVAARSPTGEILDQAPPAQTTTTTSQTTTETPATTQSTQTADAPKPATDPTKPADPAAKPSAADAPVVPDKYEFRAPDNYTIDPAALEAATPVFKELGLTQDQAQKLVDIQIAREIALAKAPQDAVETMRKGWRGETESHSEIKATVDKNSGKTGMDAVKVNIARTLSVLPVDLQVEFKDAMNLTGAGDHPAFVRAFNKLAAFITEGSPVGGKNPSELGQVKPGTQTRPDVASAMYPTLPRG